MTAKPRRRRLSYSLRTVFVLVTIACIVLGTWVSRSIQQRNAVAAIAEFSPTGFTFSDSRRGGQMEGGGPQPLAPTWLVEWLGIDFFETVTSVEIRTCQDRDLIVLRNLPSVRWLYLNGCPDLTDAGLASIGSLKNLEELHLSNLRVTGQGLKACESLSNLSVLDLHFCENLSDDGLTQIGKLSGLRTLSIVHGPELTSQGIAELRHLTNLEALSLPFGRLVSEDVLERLAPLVNLRELNLEFYYHGKQSATGLKHVAVFPRLETLTLTDYATDEPLTTCPVLPTVRRLQLTCSDVSGDSLAKLAAFPNLKHLALVGILRMDERAFESIPHSSQLTDLEILLTGSQLTDASLKSISRLKSLERLTMLGMGELTDDGLLSLTGLPRLESLCIEDRSNRISPAARLKLQTALPKCRIVY